VAIDGSQYVSSLAIQCSGCWRKTSRGVTRYSHQMLPATLVCPGERLVMPMDAEEVRHEPGAEVQDGEVGAAKRLVRRWRREHRRLKMVLSGDGLYAHEPIIQVMEEEGTDYILVAQPGDHQALFEWVQWLPGIGKVASGAWSEDGWTYRYRMAAQVPLNGQRQRSRHLV